jgi:hypothetical protein
MMAEACAACSGALVLQCFVGCATRAELTEAGTPV